MCNGRDCQEEGKKLLKKNVLIFCSWLEAKSNIGIFFREQADLIAEKYNPVLVVFKKKSSSNFFFTRKPQIVEKKTESGLIILEVFYSHNTKYSHRKNSALEILALRSFNNYLLRQNLNPSFIHAQSLFDAGIWAYYYYSLFGTPYILTEHNQLTFFKVSIEKCDLIVDALNNSKKNLVVSNDKIRQFITNGLYFDFENIGNLISKNFFFSPEKQNYTIKKLITIGAYTLLKDQRTLLDALQIVDLEIANKVEFIWVGYDGWGGNHDREVKQLLSKYQFKNINVLLLPLLNREEIADYLQKSDLFIFSSLTEGMPVSVLEALACGLPVFTSNCGGVDEVVNHENGAIFQIKDYKRLADLILKFLNKEQGYNRKLISENIIQKFGENAFREKLLSIYEQLN